MAKTKRALLSSLLILTLCVSAFAGSTFAWFSDSVTSSGNIIKSGDLEAKMYWTTAADTGRNSWVDVEDPVAGPIFTDEIKWEPGYTEVRYIKIKNTGNLAFQSKLEIVPYGTVGELAEVIKVYCEDMDIKDIDRSTLLERLPSAGTLKDVATGSNAVMVQPEVLPGKEVVLTLALKMDEDAGNQYQGKTFGDSFDIRLSATQLAYESDDFDNSYDSGAHFPDINLPVNVTQDITGLVENGVLSSAVTLSGDHGVSVTVPANTAIKDGATELTLKIEKKNKSDSNVSVSENEELKAFDVHVDGIADGNAVPLIVNMGAVLPVGLNEGNLKLYHVEGSTSNIMTKVDSLAELTAHNTFVYNPANGDLTVAMASFSEVAVVADTENAWNGTVATAFASGSGTETDPYIIANADQLAYLGDCVSNENANYGSAHYKLVADVNIGGSENWSSNKIVLYPIGYTAKGDGTNKAGEEWYTYGGAFSGTFDGAGHIISGIYQNTWAMDGNYDNGYWNAAMGLFGYVYNGTVKNLTIDNFYSEGEFAPTGCVTAHAGGNATFENIAIINSHPQTYNTGVAGIVGWDEDDGSDYTFKNITIDSSNTISALWGSWDVAAAGLLGYLGPNSEANLENCHVSATIDVYNDVCGNYQYYWYRYCGMMIGTVDKRLDNGKGALDLSNITATNCTVDFGTRHEYYYCEFIENSKASYTHDYQFSRVDNGDIIVSGESATCKNHNHEEHGYETIDGKEVLVEDKQAVYIPFRQLFGGYGWGVDGVDLGEYDNIEINAVGSVEKFTKSDALAGNFLYRIGNQNEFPIGKLFKEITADIAVDSGVHVSVTPLNDGVNMVGTFKPNEEDWTQSTLHITGGTGPAKLIIQDYNNCVPYELVVEVVDAKNLINAEGTNTGGNFVLLCDVNTTNYVNYWNSTLYGNGFTYSLNGAPTAYNSKQGHGILITKNATLDNVVIVGDVYNSYGAYTNQDYYNSAIDVVGDTTINNCYISGCAAPVSTRANATITNTTLYGGTVGNLIIKSGTVTLEDVTTANYDDGRSLVGMGIVIHSDATESAKLVLNGTLTQHNFISESKIPTDTYAKNLHTTMFGDSCSKYHFGTSPNRYVNAGIVSLTALFNAEDITDNANTGYVGTAVTVSGVNGYVYTQPNTSGSVNNNHGDYEATTQGTVAPSYSFDYTDKNYLAKTDGSNDYCYEENGKVNISMDEGDTFNWDTSILTIGKGITDYTVSMNGTDYTGKSIAFNTAGDYTVTYTYTDDNNSKLDETGNIMNYSVTYTQTVNITVAVVKETTKHAEFTFGSSNTASTTVTVGNNTYVMPNVSATSSTIGSTTVSGQTIYYPIVEIVMSDGKTSHTSGWYAYFPVFSGAVTITDYKDNGLGDAETFGSSTQSMPSGLSIVGDPAQLFKYQSSSTAGTSPVVKNNILVYSSPSISAKRSEYNTVIQYSYQDNAGATYYYYIGYHAPAQSYSSCVTPDTLITLADGSQVRVDSLTGSEQLLVWNHTTGALDVAPIAYIVNHDEEVQEHEVIYLFFEDGTDVKIIGEHVFFDATLNKYVTLNTDADEFIGHEFLTSSKADGTINTADLVKVEKALVETAAYEVVTDKHLTCFTDNVLSASAYMDKLLNIFDVDPETMGYTSEDVQKDIETYGLYTYEDFVGLISEEAFELYNAKYLKIAVGKGYIDWNDILDLIDIYFNVEVTPLV